MLSNLFTNKTVAIVGNADSLFSQDYGKSIDSYDIVCRMNRGCQIDYPMMQGSKTSACFQSPPHLWKDVETDAMIVHATSRYRNDQYNKQFVAIPQRSNEVIRNILGVDRPSTGMLVTYFVLNCHPKSVALFGFDFKETKSFYHSKELANEKHDYMIEKRYMMKLQKENKIEIFS